MRHEPRPKKRIAISGRRDEVRRATERLRVGFGCKERGPWHLAVRHAAADAGDADAPTRHV